MRRSISTVRAGLTVLLCVATAGAAGAEEADAELRTQIQALIEQNREMQRELRELRDEVRVARDEAGAAQRQAERTSAAKPAVALESPSPALASRSFGRANLQLLDLSLDTLTSFGWSSVGDGDLEQLEAGDHDPRRRGFNLQQVELGFRGAVDPYLTGDAYLVYFLDPDGESRFEIEEAFATSMRLPFGLEEQGFQVEAGQFFTEFGRSNPTHPHAWDWLDQSVVNSRLFGSDGLRNPGVRIGWLAPLPWFSELHVGAQSSQGETAVSFLSSPEEFEGGGIGGRPYDSAGVENLGDLLYLVRWVNGADFGDTWSAQWGVSGAFGPNATGGGARTHIAGTDLVVKWQPLDADRGSPSLTWQSEFAYRWYDAAGYFGCPETEDAACTPADSVALTGSLLRDWGLSTQLLWGFARSWSTGLRFEYATGSGSDMAFDGSEIVPVSRNTDPFRDDRYRVSPLLMFRPTEFSRLRLQYNYDHAAHLHDPDVHTGWLGLQFLFGAHGAHAY